MKLLQMIYLKFESRLKAFGDKSAWFLILPALGVLMLIDAPRVASITVWMLFGAVLAGFCVQISRIVWPGVDLPQLIAKAREEPLPASIIVAAIIIFVAVMFLSLALWTKP